MTKCSLIFKLLFASFNYHVTFLFIHTYIINNFASRTLIHRLKKFNFDIVIWFHYLKMKGCHMIMTKCSPVFELLFALFNYIATFLFSHTHIINNSAYSHTYSPPQKIYNFDIVIWLHYFSKSGLAICRTKNGRAILWKNLESYVYNRPCTPQNMGSLTQNDGNYPMTQGTFCAHASVTARRPCFKQVCTSFKTCITSGDRR